MTKEQIIKCNWQEIRELINKVNPEFASIVDDIDPPKSYNLYVVKYPYGMTIADKERFYLPHGNEGLPIDSSYFSKELKKDLEYGSSTIPTGMLFDKNVEYYIDNNFELITIPWKLCYPGTIFSISRTLKRGKHKSYSPNNLLILTSGARSVFMLPHIGCNLYHDSLQRELNIGNSAPKNLYDHWDIFKKIANYPALNCEWESSILFFSKQWLEAIFNKKSWIFLKSYLYEYAWRDSEYRRNHTYNDVAFSFVQKKRNLKPNPYLADTVRHLLTIMLNAAPGYAPSTDESNLPTKLIQQIYLESYGLKKYIPTIISPKRFYFSEEDSVYYSLNMPSTPVFSPKSRKEFSTIKEIRELKHLTDIFFSELSDAEKKNVCSDTIAAEAVENTEIDFYYNKYDAHNTIKHTSELIEVDGRFKQALYKNESNNVFSQDAAFVRGCIRFSGNKKKNRSE